MERKTLARWLVSAALVCFGILFVGAVASADEGTVIQGQNGSADSAAESADASASNDLTFGAGPNASGDGSGAQASQNGDNVGSMHQGSQAHSGDASAGSQIFGVVGSGHIQAQNSSDGAEASSGAVDASNTADGIFLGPLASGDGDAAQASQVGDNRLDVSQIVIAASGDAVAGSQVTGIVGSGDHSVQLQNSSEDPVAESGEVEASNEIDDFTVGPVADSEDADALASQIGDNDASLRQVADVTSGDALAASSVTGIVGDGGSDVQGQSSSTDAEATSGDVLAGNLLDAVTIGPNALSDGDTAQASQFGDNSADIDQTVKAGSGDAIAGSQVTGLVTQEAGHVTVQNQQSSDGDIATSGDVDTEGNEVSDVVIGPSAEASDLPAQASQTGDNDFDLSQSGTIRSGDAVAGSQVTGLVGGIDGNVQNQNASVDSESTSGDVSADLLNSVEDLTTGPSAFSDGATAQASQSGDNRFAADQSAELASGDAVAGSQVTGVVSTRDDLTIQNQNTADGAVSESGEVSSDTVNELSELVIGAEAESADDVAAASQIGDNDLAVGQSAHLMSGDAVAGAQVTGVVAGHGDVTVQNQSSSADDEATSGDVDVDTANSVVDGGLGPAALTDDAPAQASQSGDNAAAIDQSATLMTGDAVAGAQVTGVIADGGDTTVQNQNTSEDSEAVTGDIDPDLVNAVEGFSAGPVAESIDEDALSSQIGDNAFAVAQVADVTSGDAVAGAQVTGVVNDPASITVQNQNSSSGAASTSGDAASGASLNSIEDAFVGPSALADGDTASATQSGDNELALAQEATVSSGDAVAGAQVTGVVANHGDVTVQNQLSSEDAEAESGAAADDSDVNTIDTVSAGPLADGIDAPASAAQLGDSSASIDQTADVASGDAVAGSQVTGVVGGSGGVTVQAQQTSIDAVATTGDASAENLAEDIVVGPQASADGDTAQAGQVGNNSLDLDQSAIAHSGDAVAGSQVVGAVADDALVQIQNFDDAAEAETADAESENSATGTVGPLADAIDDVANTSQLGDSDLDVEQVGDAVTGDAVAGGQVMGIAGSTSSAGSTGHAQSPASTNLVGDGSFVIGSAAAA